MQKVQELLNSLPVFVWQGNLLGQRMFRNCSWETYTGRIGKKMSDDWVDSVHPNDVAKIAEVYENELPYKIEYRILSVDGDYHWFLDMGNPTYNKKGRLVGFVGTITDIDDQKLLQEELIFNSTHDAMTGLTNQGYFNQYLKTVLSPREKQNIFLGLIYADVNGLKEVNDTLGHGEGNLLIIAVANILRRSFRPEDVVSRLGGDEFAIVIFGLDTDLASFLEKKCQMINDTILEYNLCSEHPFNISLALGFSVFSGQTIEELKMEADKAMYRNKQKIKQKTA